MQKEERNGKQSAKNEKEGGLIRAGGARKQKKLERQEEEHDGVLGPLLEKERIRDWGNISRKKTELLTKKQKKNS